MACTAHLTQPGALLAVALVVALSAAPRAVAGEEVREFTTSIDNSQAGSYRMTITDQNDGSVTMQGEASINMRVLVVRTYTYSYRGTETWKDGLLQKFESNSNDNGKKFQVLAEPAAGGGLQVTVNGNPRVLARPDVWVTTYWRLPEAKRRAQLLPLLDGDTGKDMTATLQFIDTQPLKLLGNTVKFGHYRLGGAVQVDLWYDGTDRLVRQEWMEGNHKVVLELTRWSKR